MMDSKLEDTNRIIQKWKEKGINFWAMQLFASGKNDFDSFISGLQLQNFEGLVYGTSKKERVFDFANKIKEARKLEY